MDKGTVWFLAVSSVVAITVIAVVADVGGWLHWVGHPNTVTALATFGTAIVLAVSAFFALRGVEDARKSRHAQIIMELSKEWDSDEMMKSRSAFAMKGESEVKAFVKRHYDPKTGRTLEQYKKDLEEAHDLFLFPNLIERIGVLHDGGIVTSAVVYKLWGAPVAFAWRQWAPIVDEVQKAQPNAFKYFDKLDADMREYAASRGETFPARP